MSQLVNTHEDELNKLFAITSGAISDLKRSMGTAVTQVDALEAVARSSGGGTSVDVQNQLQRLSTLVTDLAADRDRDRRKIEALESRLEQGTAKFHLNNGTTLRSALDVRTFMLRENGGDRDFGYR